MKKFILALDQGTTSSRAILFNRKGRSVASAQKEFPQILPTPGHVEHDPEAIWTTQREVAKRAIANAKIEANQVAAIGITNQRETTILWDKKTGKPIDNAIVWQSRVSAEICDRLKEDGYESLFREKTGLLIDAYFSATKIRHLLNKHAGLKTQAEKGDILFGTVDTFLIWRLTGGKVHVTDYSNASRTMLFNIHTLDWDDELLKILDIPRAMLPDIRSSSEVYGETDSSLFGTPIPIAGDAGDQQAALFGQACFEKGDVKNTFGTGCFMLQNTGAVPVVSKNRLLTTIAWGLNGQVTYALEGSVFIGGAIVQWLRDGLKIIQSSADVETLAASVPDNGGVVVVPAFVGLGAPHWDSYARGTIFGLTRGTTDGHIARAALEAIALQTRDLLIAMREDSQLPVSVLKVDGGASINASLMQFQADILNATVQRPVVSETTALGAAYLAGLAVGYWNDTNDIANNWALDEEYTPTMNEEKQRLICSRWKKAISRSLDWEEH